MSMILMNKKKRGRPETKPFIKRLIFEKGLEHKDMPRQALAVELTHLIEKMGEISPSEETIIRWISDARNRKPDPLDESNPLNMPWSISTITKHDFPSEVIPMLLKIQEDLSSKGKKPMTIREAWWAYKLHNVIKSPKTLRFTQESLLYEWAKIYAKRQVFSEFVQEPFDTQDLDRLIAQYAEIYALHSGIWLDLQGKYGFEETARQMSEVYEAMVIVDAPCKSSQDNEIEDIKRESSELKLKNEKQVFVNKFLRNWVEQLVKETILSLNSMRLNKPKLYDSFMKWKSIHNPEGYEWAVKSMADLQQKEAQNERVNKAKG